MWDKPGRGHAAPTPNNRRTNGCGCGGVVGGAKARGGVVKGEGVWPKPASANGCGRSNARRGGAWQNKGGCGLNKE